MGGEGTESSGQDMNNKSKPLRIPFNEPFETVLNPAGVAVGTRMYIFGGWRPNGMSQNLDVAWTGIPFATVGGSWRALPLE